MTSHEDKAQAEYNAHQQRVANLNAFAALNTPDPSAERLSVTLSGRDWDEVLAAIGNRRELLRSRYGSALHEHVIALEKIADQIAKVTQ